MGRTWGNVPSLSPAEENVWHVVGIDRAAERAFHLSSYLISGTTIDRWFEQGIGIARETILHHGTYTEDRRELLKAIIRGKTHKLSE